MSFKIASIIGLIAALVLALMAARGRRISFSTGMRAAFVWLVIALVLFTVLEHRHQIAAWFGADKPAASKPGTNLEGIEPQGSRNDPTT